MMFCILFSPQMSIILEIRSISRYNKGRNHLGRRKFLIEKIERKKRYIRRQGYKNYKVTAEVNQDHNSTYVFFKKLKFK